MKLLLTVTVLWVLYALEHAGLTSEVVTNPVISCVLLDAFLIHILTGASRREAILTTVIGGIASWVWWRLSPTPLYFWSALGSCGVVLGMTSLVVLSVSALLKTGEAGREKLRAFGRSSVFLCMGLFAVPFLTFATHLSKFDNFLYRFDAGFGAQPSFLVGRVFRSMPLLNEVELVIYLVLAVPVGLVYIGHLQHRRWPVDILQGFILNAVVGYALFWMFPASGPVFAFPDQYPFSPPPVSEIQPARMAIEGLPNAMPSVHVSTVLLIWFNCRPWLWARWLSALFAGATVLSTLGLGQHYLIDLVVAFPYALLIQSLSATASVQKRFWMAGTGLTAGWILLLRFGQEFFPTRALRCLQHRRQ